MRVIRLILCLQLLLFCAGCGEKILHGLDELRANQVTVVLARAGIDSRKVRDGSSWAVEVDDDSVTGALQALEESRILMRDLTRFRDQPSGLLMSREERAHHLERKFAWNLEQTLERVPGVLEARVHLFEQDGDPDVFAAAQESDEVESGSVLLVTDGNTEISPSYVQQLVSGASGIPAKQISVLLSAKAPRVQLVRAAWRPRGQFRPMRL